MGSVSWRTQISFLLAGMIFVLCHMIVSNRGAVEEAALSQTGDRSYRESLRDETFGRGGMSLSGRDRRSAGSVLSAREADDRQQID